MTDLSDLYQEVIIDHDRHPRNFGKLTHVSHTAEGFNPLCGDQVTLYLHINDNDVITDLAFEGKGCAISTASASLMTESLKGKTRQEAEALFDSFHHFLTDDSTEGKQLELGKLQAMGGVKAFPTRIKCATLAWHTLRAALRGENGIASSE